MVSLDQVLAFEVKGEGGGGARAGWGGGEGCGRCGRALNKPTSRRVP